MSVLVKGLAMDFVRQDRNQMAITSIWPASVCLFNQILAGYCGTNFSSLLNQQQQSTTNHLISPIRKTLENRYVYTNQLCEELC